MSIKYRQNEVWRDFYVPSVISSANDKDAEISALRQSLGDINRRLFCGFGNRSTLAYKAHDSSSIYSNMQGGCTDGTYLYWYWRQPAASDGDNVPGLLVKMSLADGSIVSSLAVCLHHCNGMTYNPDTGYIYAIYDYSPLTVKRIDPSTLAVVDTLTADGISATAIAYDTVNKRYVGRSPSTTRLFVADEKFNLVRWLDTPMVTVFGKQDIECDDNYIYDCYWDDDSCNSWVSVFDWNGNAIARIDIPTSEIHELEFCALAGSFMYFGGNVESYKGYIVRKAAQRRLEVV